MKRFALFALAGAVAALISGIVAAADITFRAGHSAAPGEPYDEGLKHMKAGLEKLTNGTATMQIFPNSQVGNEPQMIEGVLTGSLDIAVPSNAPLTNFVPELKIFDMPFLFKDQRHMNRVLRGPARDEIAKAVAAKNLQLLGVYGVGTRHIMTTKKKVLSIDDLKGLKIRTMQSQYHLDAFRAFGANPTAVAYSELYGSLQTGVVDGAEAANTNYFNQKFYEQAPNWAMVGWTILTAPLIMQKRKFDGLPKDLQNALMKAGEESAIYEQDLYNKTDDALLEELKKRGIAVTQPDLKPFLAAAQQVHSKHLTSATDKRILKLIQDTP